MREYATVHTDQKAPETRLRPWLTASSERLLLRLVPSVCETAPEPLPVVPRRLLIVKVFGMGDSILIRSIVQRLRERHPNMQIGVLLGPATREVLTMEAWFRIHQYVPRQLNVGSALRMLADLRS